eukprot:TRINITY_DN1726_c0_g2_i1.p2 TRINITY_DN1726_c0_g2~~TRINITY_DN1726_c0_g2_i1.p2  ORF type:complete len:498 (-),score=73.41 TRINITY_DN1726_c0_g2_i1:216-1709(-)
MGLMLADADIRFNVMFWAIAKEALAKEHPHLQPLRDLWGQAGIPSLQHIQYAAIGHPHENFAINFNDLIQILSPSTISAMQLFNATSIEGEVLRPLYNLCKPIGVVASHNRSFEELSVSGPNAALCRQGNVELIVGTTTRRDDDCDCVLGISTSLAQNCMVVSSRQGTEVGQMTAISEFHQDDGSDAYRDWDGCRMAIRGLRASQQYAFVLRPSAAPFEFVMGSVWSGRRFHAFALGDSIKSDCWDVTVDSVTDLLPIISYFVRLGAFCVHHAQWRLLARELDTLPLPAPLQAVLAGHSDEAAHVVRLPTSSRATTSATDESTTKRHKSSGTYPKILLGSPFELPIPSVQLVQPQQQQLHAPHLYHRRKRAKHVDLVRASIDIASQLRAILYPHVIHKTSSHIVREVLFNQQHCILKLSKSAHEREMYARLRGAPHLADPIVSTEIDGLHVLIFRYLHSYDLQSSGQLWRTIQSVAESLVYFHQHGVVHWISSQATS